MLAFRISDRFLLLTIGRLADIKAWWKDMLVFTKSSGRNDGDNKRRMTQVSKHLALSPRAP
jgi:hypothetical protein